MIVVATEAEARAAHERFRGEDVLVTGVSASNVIKALEGQDRGEPIINFGYAGSNCLPIGAECEVGTVQLYHPNVDYCDVIYHLGGKVPCYTGVDFVLNTDIKEPALFDMELAFILAMGFTNVRAFKVVSDNLSLHDYEQAVHKGD